jgi:hypothetical protein
MKIEDIKIDPELRDFLLPLSEEEEKQLRGSLLVDGCLSPLIVDSITGTLLDGHNRYRICSEKNIPFEIKEISMSRKERQKEFILINQLARRNLTPERMKYYTAMLYESVKGEAGFKEGNPGDKKHWNDARCQNGTARESASKASEKVSKMVNRAPRTVMRDVAEVKAVREAGKLDEYNAGKLPKKEVKAIVEASKPVRKQTKAEADEEAEILSSPENQHLIKEMPSNNNPVDQYKRVRKLVEKLKSLGLTSEEKQYIKTELEAV